VIYRFERFELDEAAGELRRDDAAVSIQPKPLALLTLLIRERHRIVSFDELLERLWPGEAVTPSSLSRAASLARSAIGDSGRSGLIRSYTRRGYRFHGPVVEFDGEGPDDAIAAPAAASLEPAAGALPFVGRDDALLRLRAAWNRAAGGRGGVAILSGPAGIGKTRLAEVFGREVERRGGLALRGRALEDEGEPAFWVWAQVLRRLQELDPESLRVRGLAETGELAALMPEIGAPETSAAGALPAEQRRFIFFDAVARALARAARRRPVLVIFEDVHWADSASLRLLEHLAFELAATPLLLVATVREDRAGRDAPGMRTLSVLRRQERCETVSLGSLGAEDVNQLVERAAGRAMPDLARRLRARTEGVPLFLREALRRLGERGGFDDPRRLDANVPLADVNWVGDALGALSAPCAALVAAASVVGREFPLPLVAGIADVAREEALDLLDEAVEAGVVEADPEARVRYRFVHDLFRESAYAGLASGARAHLHHRAAEWLERQHAEELERVVAELAHHHHRALAVGDPERAYVCAARAAERAFRLCAYENAALHWRQALAALNVAESVDPVRRLDVLVGLGEAYGLSGDRTLRRQHFGQALELARDLGSTEAFATAAIGLCDLAEWGVRDDVARSALEEARERLESPAPELEARILTRLGYLASLFDRERAERDLRRAVDIARKHGEPETLEDALYALHFVLGGPDGLRERAELLEELRAAAAAARHPVTAVIAVLDVACDRLELGELASAVRLRDEADRMAGDPPHPRTVWHRNVYDTGIALMEGRLDEVEGRVEEALALGRRLQHPYARGCATGHLARLHVERGAHASALALLEPALGFEQGPREWLCALVSRTHLALGRVDDARARYTEVLDAGVERIPRNLRWTATLIELAHCCADLEDTDRAGELLRGLRSIEGHHAVMPMVVCYGGPATWAAARLHALVGDADAAEELYGDALDAVRSLAARPTEARIRLDLGRLLRRRGKRPRAREELAAAAALAADLGMAGLEEAATRQLG
jgi:DNA-binding winged helix-turn-helix (wHTH) protein/tetratricopeptide (TPR) repeat protein